MVIAQLFDISTYLYMCISIYIYICLFICICILSNHDVGCSRKTLLPRARCSFTVEESEYTLWSPPHDTLWVLRQKRGSRNEKTKKKARICYNGKMQKSTAARDGRVIETFAPTVRHTTFKLLAAHGCVTKRRARQFDVEGAYLKGKFEDGEVVYARPPPNFPGGARFRHFDDRGVPLVWRL